MATERFGDKPPIFHRIIANLSSRDIDNRTFDEHYLSLRVVAIELDHVLWLSNIEGNLFRTIRIPVSYTHLVINYLQEVADEVKTTVGTTSITELLEQFLFPRSTHGTQIAKLSGGEKKRLYLLDVYKRQSLV